MSDNDGSSDRSVPVIRPAIRGTVQLHDNGLRAGNLINQSISRLDESQVKALGAEAAKEALRLEVKRTEQNMDYVSGKKAAEDHIDAWNMLDKSGKTTRQKLGSEIKTGAGKMKIESTSGATCFVASVSYGSPNHSDVMYLRWYRDNVLMRHRLGRAFSAFYWRVGPRLAKVVSLSSTARAIARAVIGQIVPALRRLHPDE